MAAFFVNIKDAYNAVDFNILEAKLEHLGVPPDLAKAIVSLFTN